MSRDVVGVMCLEEKVESCCAQVPSPMSHKQDRHAVLLSCHKTCVNIRLSYNNVTPISTTTTSSQLGEILVVQCNYSIII